MVVTHRVHGAVLHRPARHTAIPARPEFCELVPPSRTGPALALATDHPDRISPRPGTGWTPILVVDDFDATVAELRQRGVSFDAGEEGADEGYRLVRVLDPEGNAIGITT
jgi:catechol 2,3-dioxygenase-like lactoylglutathione lyase family enzyme